MTKETDIELFVLKNAVITRSLRSLFAKQNMSGARGPLEAQADSLVSEYLKQVDFEIVAAAERMSEFYKLFYALENDIRDLIESALIENKGEDWWETAVPQIVRENVSNRRDERRRRRRVFANRRAADQSRAPQREQRSRDGRPRVFKRASRRSCRRFWAPKRGGDE